MFEGQGTEMGRQGAVPVRNRAQVPRAGHGTVPLAGTQGNGDDERLRQPSGGHDIVPAVMEEARGGAEPDAAIRVHPGGEGIAVRARQPILPPEEA